MTKWTWLPVAAFAAVVATAGFVLPGGAADLETRVSGVALYTAWAAIGALPALLFVAVIGAGVRRGIAFYLRSGDGVS